MKDVMHHPHPKSHNAKQLEIADEVHEHLSKPIHPTTKAARSASSCFSLCFFHTKNSKP